MQVLRRWLAAFCLGAVLWPAPGLAEGERAGDFDYYVMSLSWSSNWCALVGDGRGDPQCDAGRGLTFTLHGLWPQNERGWPSYCRTGERDPTRGETAAMADIMGGAGLAFYEWKKHGRCSGLSAADYFALTRKAAALIAIPATLRNLPRDVSLPAKVVEDAFIEANPELSRDGVTVTCRDRALQEVRICLTPNLQPRPCAPDTRRDCSGSFLMPAPR